MSEVEELDNPSSKNKCVDQIRGVCEAHLRLYLSLHMQKISAIF